MLVAKEKIRTNIGEYLLYMFQIEDLIRACNFNKTIIETKLVAQYQTDESTKDEIKDWYFGLSDLMEEEKLGQSGHLSIITNKMNEVNDFHLYLLNRPDQTQYQDKYKQVASILQELKQKQNKETNDIECITNAIYGVYMLKLKQQEVTSETMESTSTISKFMALLSKMFTDYEQGKFKFE